MTVQDTQIFSSDIKGVVQNANEAWQNPEIQNTHLERKDGHNTRNTSRHVRNPWLSLPGKPRRSPEHCPKLRHRSFRIPTLGARSMPVWARAIDNTCNNLLEYRKWVSYYEKPTPPVRKSLSSMRQAGRVLLENPKHSSRLQS